MLTIDLSGRVALVTGASGQLGRVIVKTLADCGAHIIIHYCTNKEIAQALHDKVREHKRDAFVCQADVTDEESVFAMKEQIERKFKMPDIVVNCAIIRYGWRTVLEQDVADFQGQLNSCVIHNLLIAKAFVPTMIRNKWGRVISLNTECVMQCYPKQGAYVTGKRGMDGLLRVLGREVAQYQVTVNQVAPGWMVTERHRTGDVVFTEEEKSYLQRVPMKRRGKDLDVAHLVAFLASDLASFITGAFIPVCGGTIMPSI